MFNSKGSLNFNPTIPIRVGVALALLVGMLNFTAASATDDTWSPLGEGLNADVYVLAFDSSGNLYAGGSFTTAGGVTANRIAKWDGASWSALGSGVGGTSAEVNALAVDEDGNLYAGGSFTTAGGASANRIAKWDGISWSALGSGMDGRVNALIFDSAGNLYAGGNFTTAGGASADHIANRIAKWDGSSWSALGNNEVSNTIRALVVDGSGNLYAGGSFASPASRIAKWDGASWSALGSGVNTDVYALAADGSGNLYAGGSFTSPANHIAKWNGSAWSALGSGMNDNVSALALDSSGNLYAGGSFTTAGGASADHIAKWDGSAWSALGSGVGGTTSPEVDALVAEDGNLYVGGDFTTAGGVTTNHIAKWVIPASVEPGTGSSLFCTGESTTVSITLTNVTDLFGYQLIVHYDPSLVSATGAFVNTFFNTGANASIPSGWNASCSSGGCKFAASKVEPGTPVTGSGAVAQLTLTGLSAGTFDITLSEDILSDREAQAIAHTKSSLHLTVCGFATVSGTVSLQGRTTPVNVGQVTLTDLGGYFGPYSANFNASTGAFTINNVRVMPGGSSYQFDAAHGLYLGNRMTHTLNPLDSYAAPSTRLLGGDANNDGLIDLSDLTCIGGSFGGAPVTCGTTGSSDINADGAVNILDLVLSAGNYGLTAPRTW